MNPLISSTFRLPITNDVRASVTLGSANNYDITLNTNFADRYKNLPFLRMNFFTLGADLKCNTIERRFPDIFTASMVF